MKNSFGYLVCMYFALSGSLSSVFPTVSSDPCSEENLEKEDLFFAQLEKNLKEKSQKESKTFDSKTETSDSKKINSQAQPKISKERETSLPLNQLGKLADFSDKSLKDSSSFSFNSLSSPSLSLKKKEERVKDRVEQPSHIVNQSAASLISPSPKKFKGASGLYGGLGFHINQTFIKANLCSLAHQARKPGQSNYSLTKSETRTIYYGSFAYNRNECLLNADVFFGYNFPLSKRFYLGIEVQGGLGWHKAEIASNGVYAVRGDDYLDLGYSEQFKDKGYTVKEVNFSYTRPTLENPYYLSFLPRFCIALSKRTILYTTFGIRYGSWEITDRPDTIDPVTSYDIKQGNDTIYSKGDLSFIGGLGIETNLNKHFFVRVECLYSNGPTISIQDPSLQQEKDKEISRQLESVDISSIRDLSFGFGAGFRF